MTKELELRVLKDGDCVSFDPFDHSAPTPGESYGRAEFSLCPVFRAGRIQTLWIYPLQQRNVKFYYRVDAGRSTSLMVQSWTHKGVDRPEVWTHMWCKEHRCTSMRVYVPTLATRFQIQILSSLYVNFDK